MKELDFYFICEGSHRSDLSKNRIKGEMAGNLEVSSGCRGRIDVCLSVWGMCAEWS